MLDFMPCSFERRRRAVAVYRLLASTVVDAVVGANA